MKKYCKSILASLLILTFTFPVISGASTLNTIAQNYKVKLRPQRPPKTFVKSSIDTAANTFNHQSQALILILMLTGIEIVRQQMALSNVRQESIPMEEILKHSQAAAEHILKSGEIWSSMLGAGVVSKVLSKPVAVLQAMINNSKALPILKSLLSNGIATLTVFLGWELGAQLFIEARELLEDENEYERSENIMPVLLNVIQGRIGLNSPEYTRDASLLNKMLGNVMKILIYDHELRNLWFYNAFRHRIATGEFATLVSSMVGAVTIGTAIFPGAGTAAGFMFGLTGGVLTLFIPIQSKDRISNQIKTLRKRFWMMGREGYGLLSFMNFYETIIRISAEKIRSGEPLPPLLQFRYNPYSINEIMTAQFERMAKLESNLQASRVMYNEAKKFNNSVAELKYKKIVDETSADYLKTLSETQRIYSIDINHLEELFRKYDYHALMNDEAITTKYALVTEFKNLRSRLKTVDEFISNTLIPSIRMQMQMPVPQKSYMSTLQKFNLMGYDETALWELIRGS